MNNNEEAKNEKQEKKQESTIKKIIDIMNAQIYIESELGKGTTFTVKLDIQENKNKKYII